jgi:hypothetical protein
MQQLWQTERSPLFLRCADDRESVMNRGTDNQRLGQTMGRSFDRGGQSRKERERGKRRAYRQAEQNREALEAVRLAKRKSDLAEFSRLTASRTASTPAAVTAHTVVQPIRPVAIIEQKQPGFLAKMFGRIFRKSA